MLSVSVVVPSHNGAGRLARLLEAMVVQDFSGTWELIISLDGSTDDSHDVIDSYTQRLPLRVLTAEVRNGAAAALNTGFNAAFGDVLVRCDDDLVPGSDFIGRHEAWHRERSNLGVIGLTRDVFPDTPYARKYGRFASERTLNSSLQTPASRRWVHWAANNSIRRAIWDQSGGFDTRLLYGQDSEFGFRLHRLGVEIVIDPALTVLHTGPATTTSRRARRAYIAGAASRMRERLHPEARQSFSVPSRSWLWEMAKSATTQPLRSADDCEVLGRAVDRLLPVLPQGAGRRLVALAVESSAAAGYASDPQDQRAFASQKTLELAEEASLASRGQPSATPDPGPQDAISVVIPSYGDPLPAQELVNRLLAQTGASDLQVIVSDDASPTPYPDDPRVTIHRAPQNRGFGAAANAGAKLAANPWLLIVNSDIEFDESFLQRLIPLASLQQPAVCGVRQVAPNGDPLVAARRDHTPASVFLSRQGLLAPLARFRGFRRAANIVLPSEEVAGPVDWLTGSLLLMPRDAFKTAGGFDERFYMYAEEADLQRRLRGLGYPAVLIAELQIRHFGGASSSGINVKDLQLRSHLLYLEKWYGRRTSQGVARLLRLTNQYGDV